MPELHRIVQLRVFLLRRLRGDDHNMIVKHRINMDLDHANEAKRVDVVQDDRYSRDLEITLESNMKAFCPPDGCSVLVRYSKPNKQCGAYDTMPNGEKAWSIDGNVVTVKLAPQVCTTAGDVRLTVSLLYGDAELSCFEVCVHVQKIPGSSLRSEEYINIRGFIPQPNRAAAGEYIKVTATDKFGRVMAVTTSSEVAVDGKDGKSAYAFAQDGGYTGTEEDFAAKLAEEAPRAFYITVTQSGTTYSADRTVEEIEAAYQAGRSLHCYCYSALDKMTYCLSYGGRYNDGAAFAFGNASCQGVMTVIITGSVVQVVEGPIPSKTSQLTNDSGFLTTAPVTSVNGQTGAVQLDIPTVPSALPNPKALTINGSTYDGSTAVDLTEAVTALIDTKIGAVTNAEEVAF